MSEPHFKLSSDFKYSNLDIPKWYHRRPCSVPPLSVSFSKILFFTKLVPSAPLLPIWSSSGFLKDSMHDAPHTSWACFLFSRSRLFPFHGRDWLLFLCRWKPHTEDLGSLGLPKLYPLHPTPCACLPARWALRLLPEGLAHNG